jgi:hypothetical protein
MNRPTLALTVFAILEFVTPGQGQIARVEHYIEPAAVLNRKLSELQADDQQLARGMQLIDQRKKQIEKDRDGFLDQLRQLGATLGVIQAQLTADSAEPLRERDANAVLEAEQRITEMTGSLQQVDSDLKVAVDEKNTKEVNSLKKKQTQTQKDLVLLHKKLPALKDAAQKSGDMDLQADDEQLAKEIQLIDQRKTQIENDRDGFLKQQKQLEAALGVVQAQLAATSAEQLRDKDTKAVLEAERSIRKVAGELKQVDSDLKVAAEQKKTQEMNSLKNKQRQIQNDLLALRKKLPGLRDAARKSRDIASAAFTRAASKASAIEFTIQKNGEN